MKLAAENPADELTPGQAGAAFREAWLTARIAKHGSVQRFTVKTLAARKAGGTVIADLTFDDGSVVVLRISALKARMLIDRLTEALK